MTLAALLVRHLRRLQARARPAGQSHSWPGRQAGGRASPLARDDHFGALLRRSQRRCARSSCVLFAFPSLVLAPDLPDPLSPSLILSSLVYSYRLRSVRRLHARSTRYRLAPARPLPGALLSLRSLLGAACTTPPPCSQGSQVALGQGAVYILRQWNERQKLKARELEEGKVREGDDEAARGPSEGRLDGGKAQGK